MLIGCTKTLAGEQGGTATIAWKILIMSEVRNRIPRKFNAIYGRILCETDKDRPGDPMVIYKNLFGHLGLNRRTGNYAYYPAAILRDAADFKIEEVL